MGSQRDGRSVGVRANVEDFAGAGVNEDPLPSMRTVVPWSPPNSICHRRCDRNICQSPAPSGCLCRPPARRRCRWRLQRGPWLTAASGHRRWGLGLVDVDDAAGVVRDREVELSTVRIGDLGRPDSQTAVVVVLKVEDLAVARLSFSGGDRLQCRSSLLISSLVGHEEFGAAAGLAAAILPSCVS